MRRARASSPPMAPAEVPLAFPAFLDGALAALAREAPSSYARVAALSGADGTRLRVGDATVVLRFGARAHALEPEPSPAAVDVRVDRTTILALVDGELSLLEAIASDRLRIDGATEAVLRFEQSLGAFLEGLSATRSFAPLLAAFRANG